MFTYKPKHKSRKIMCVHVQWKILCIVAEKTVEIFRYQVLKECQISTLPRPVLYSWNNRLGQGLFISYWMQQLGSFLHEWERQNKENRHIIANCHVMYCERNELAAIRRKMERGLQYFIGWRGMTCLTRKKEHLSSQLEENWYVNELVVGGWEIDISYWLKLLRLHFRRWRSLKEKHWV